MNNLISSKRPRSYIVDTSSTTSSSALFPPTTSDTEQLPISETPITPRSKSLPLSLPFSLFQISNYVPEPEPVTRFNNYKSPTATKTIRQQPQLDIVRIPDTEYTPLTSLHIPSDTDSST